MRRSVTEVPRYAPDTNADAMFGTSWRVRCSRRRRPLARLTRTSPPPRPPRDSTIAQRSSTSACRARTRVSSIRRPRAQAAPVVAPRPRRADGAAGRIHPGNRNRSSACLSASRPPPRAAAAVVRSVLSNLNTLLVRPASAPRIRVFSRAARNATRLLGVRRELTRTDS